MGCACIWRSRSLIWKIRPYTWKGVPGRIGPNTNSKWLATKNGCDSRESPSPEQGIRYSAGIATPVVPLSKGNFEILHDDHLSVWRIVFVTSSQRSVIEHCVRGVVPILRGICSSPVRASGHQVVGEPDMPRALQERVRAKEVAAATKINPSSERVAAHPCVTP